MPRILTAPHRPLSIKLFTMACTALLLFACGGGGGGGTSAPTITQMGGARQGAALNLTTAVTTLAGTPFWQDGVGAAANFDRPTGVVQVGGNLYVADKYNDTIRKIVIATKVVTTFAGTVGTFGSADGIGTAAQFGQPGGIATDGVNLYVADTDNHTIRKIVIATGVVTTLAGTARQPGSADGVGSIARFNQPYGIATDGTNLYVADTSNNAIRQVVIATSSVSTIAGGTIGYANGTGAAAQFNNPFGIAINGANLYVTDSFNSTIRQIVIASRVVTTFAGGARGSADGIGTAALFSFPGGITTDGVNLYVADGNNTIRQIVIATALVTTLSGTPGTTGSADGIGGAAQFKGPSGITNDGAHLYVADRNNFTIRQIVISTAAVTTLAGTAVYADGLGPQGRFSTFLMAQIATDGFNLYLPDTNSNTIRKIVIGTGAVTTFAGSASAYGATDGIGTAARFFSPQGITTDGTNLYVADANNCAIRQIVIATGLVSTLAGGKCGPADGVGAFAQFSHPSGITTDGTNLYVADTTNRTIRQIVIATGAVSTLAGTANNTSGSADGAGPAAQFNYPDGITTDGTRLYVADTGNHTIRQIVIATGVVSTIAGSALSPGPIDGIGTGARFSSPEGITTDGTNLYVADNGNNAIRKIVMATGVVTTLAGDVNSPPTVTNGTGTAAQFDAPYGITTDGQRLFIGDSQGGTVRIMQ